MIFNFNRANNYSAEEDCEVSHEKTTNEKENSTHSIEMENDKKTEYHTAESRIANKENNFENSTQLQTGKYDDKTKKAQNDQHISSKKRDYAGNFRETKNDWPKEDEKSFKKPRLIKNCEKNCSTDSFTMENDPNTEHITAESSDNIETRDRIKPRLMYSFKKGETKYEIYDTSPDEQVIYNLNEKHEEFIEFFRTKLYLTDYKYGFQFPKVETVVITVAIIYLRSMRYKYTLTNIFENSKKEKYRLKFNESLKISEKQIISSLECFLLKHESHGTVLEYMVLGFVLKIYSGLQTFEYEQFNDSDQLIVTLKRLPWNIESSTHCEIITILQSHDFCQNYIALTEVIREGFNTRIPRQNVRELYELISFPKVHNKYFRRVKSIIDNENLSDIKLLRLFKNSLRKPKSSKRTEEMYNQRHSSSNGIEEMDITPTERGITEPEAIMHPPNTTNVAKSSPERLKPVTQEHDLTDECDR